MPRERIPAMRELVMGRSSSPSCGLWQVVAPQVSTTWGAARMVRSSSANVN